MRGVGGRRGKIVLFGVAAALALGTASFAQKAEENREEFIRRKLSALEQFAAANQAKLRKYAWTETVRYLLKSEIRSTLQYRCRYGPDGRIVRTPLGSPPLATTAGPFRSRKNEDTKEDLEATAETVRAAVALYVPPDSRKMEQAFAAGNVRVERPIQGEALLSFQSYAKPGDSMILDFRTDTKKLVSLKVLSYLDDPSHPIALEARFATLADGTNTPENVDVREEGRGMQVMITRSSYEPLP